MTVQPVFNPISITAIALVAIAIAAWCTSVLVAIKTSAWILLAFACVFAPVGIVHGVSTWFGLA